MLANHVSLNSFWHSIGGDQARFFPRSSSVASHALDGLTMYLMGLAIFFTIGIFLALAIFVVKYRRRPGNEIAHAFPMHVKLEVAWTVIPLGLSLIAFAWGSKQFLEHTTPPQNAESIFVVGKQWMWKIEHENGVAEINELHVPVNADIQLLMISQDVIHSFFIPDFRMKYDVLPGRYTRSWFHAEQTGEYHFLCTQYCGTDHSEMIGTVTVMTAKDYQDWLVVMKQKTPVALTAVQKGEKLYNKNGCVSCHDGMQTKIGPSLTGVFRSHVELNNRTMVIADDNYLRESILNPHAKVVAGYQDVMPTYAGRMNEEELFDLVQYLHVVGQPVHAESPSRGVSLNDRAN